MVQTLIVFITLLVTAMGFGATPSTKQYSANEILVFTRIAFVTVSPNGKQVAYVTRDCNKKNNKWYYTLSFKDESRDIHEIAQADNISSVSWSPDGNSIAYIAPNKEQQVLFVYKLSDKKIGPIVKLSRGIIAFKWSPSGKQIALIAEDEKNKTSTDNLVDAANPTTNLRLYLTNVDNPTEIKPLTAADFSISYDPFTGGFSWSADGQQIAFAYQPSTRAPDDLKPKIAILNLSTLKLTTVPFCSTHSCRQPMYSPSGHWLAFTANIPASGKSKALLEDIEIRNKVCLMDQANQIHCLRDTFNTNPWLFSWNANSNAVYVLEQYKSQGLKIYELNENTSVPVKLISTHKDFIEPLSLSINRTNQIFGFGYESVNKAPEVFTATVSDFKLNQITHLNEKYNKVLGDVRALNWSSMDGTPIEGLLITPVNYDPKHKYPLYVDVHGGPSGAQSKRYLGGCDEYDEALIPTTCPANILSLGYIILQVNFRGSSGYGVNFRVKNFADLGGGDYRDIMSGIDYLIQQGIVDTSKIAIAGWSYGGYMSAWAASQTKRFFTAIDGDGMSDFVSYAATTDNTDFGLRYLGTNYWNDSHLYWVHSPMAYVNNISKPLLILHGGNDIRVPPAQGKELFTALKILGKPVKMLVAPNQSHVPTDPDTFAKEIGIIDKWLQTTRVSS